MARPKKPIDYDEEIMKIDAQITKWENTIVELKERRKSLVQDKEQEDISALYSAIKSAGVTIQELLPLIQKTKSVNV